MATNYSIYKFNTQSIPPQSFFKSSFDSKQHCTKYKQSSKITTMIDISFEDSKSVKTYSPFGQPIVKPVIYSPLKSNVKGTLNVTAVKDLKLKSLILSFQGDLTLCYNTRLEDGRKHLRTSKKNLFTQKTILASNFETDGFFRLREGQLKEYEVDVTFPCLDQALPSSCEKHGDENIAYINVDYVLSVTVEQYKELDLKEEIFGHTASVPILFQGAINVDSLRKKAADKHVIATSNTTMHNKYKAQVYDPETKSMIQNPLADRDPKDSGIRSWWSKNLKDPRFKNSTKDVTLKTSIISDNLYIDLSEPLPHIDKALVSVEVDELAPDFKFGKESTKLGKFELRAVAVSVQSYGYILFDKLKIDFKTEPEQALRHIYYYREPYEPQRHFDVADFKKTPIGYTGEVLLPLLSLPEGRHYPPESPLINLLENPIMPTISIGDYFQNENRIVYRIKLCDMCRDMNKREFINCIMGYDAIIGLEKSKVKLSAGDGDGDGDEAQGKYLEDTLNYKHDDSTEQPPPPYTDSAIK